MGLVRCRVLALVNLRGPPAMWVIALASRRKLFPRAGKCHQKSVGEVAGG